MSAIDRSVVPSLHAAARLHGSVYVSCLFTNLANRVASLFHVHPVRTAPCA